MTCIRTLWRHTASGDDVHSKGTSNTNAQFAPSKQRYCAPECYCQRYELGIEFSTFHHAVVFWYMRWKQGDNHVQCCLLSVNHARLLNNTRQQQRRWDCAVWNIHAMESGPGQWSRSVQAGQLLVSKRFREGKNMSDLSLWNLDWVNGSRLDFFTIFLRLICDNEAQEAFTILLRIVFYKWRYSHVFTAGFFQMSKK